MFIAYLYFPYMIIGTLMQRLAALDTLMLNESDRAYILMNDKMNRSMKEFILTNSIPGARSQRLYQIIDMDPSALAQIWHDGLPIETLESLLSDLKSGRINGVIDCTLQSTSTKILAAKMRDASLQGPHLQKIHEQAGMLLADRVIDEHGLQMNLVEAVEFSHVQGSTYDGLCTSSSRNILILPLMRGGEPMARGIYSKFASAQFIHFYDQETEIDKRNNQFKKSIGKMDMKRPVCIFIVDSVINTGRSIKRTIMYIQKVANEISPNMKLALFVVSGVMQEVAANELPIQFPRVRFVTLRVSSNRYTGKGGTDTGNRLFGTTLVD